MARILSSSSLAAEAAPVPAATRAAATPSPAPLAIPAPLATSVTVLTPRAGCRPLALADLAEMTKPGITLMVALTTGLGFLLAGGPVLSWQLAATLLGTCLVAAGASVLNQFWERTSDALMRRTAGRPLPSGRLDPDVALLLGVALGIAGPAGAGAGGQRPHRGARRPGPGGLRLRLHAAQEASARCRRWWARSRAPCRR